MSYALALRHGLGDLLPQRGPVDATAVTPGLEPAPAVTKDKPKVRLPVVQGQAPKFSLQSLIEQYLMTMDETQRIAVAFKYGGERSRGVFHASEVSKESACLRALAYDIYKAPLGEQEFVEVPNGITAPQMKRIFHNGHFAHARLESYIIAAVEQNKGKAWNELSYEPDGKLRSGTADVGLILYGWPYLVEIKSIKKGDKNNPDGGGFIFLGAEPDPDHKAQLNQYMGLAGVNAGFILYESKDNQALREYFVQFDKALWDKIERERVDVVLDHVKRGTLPDKISDEDGCSGTWCKFYAICKKRGGPKWLPGG